jgi:hypothetical protein
LEQGDNVAASKPRFRPASAGLKRGYQILSGVKPDLP